MYLQCVVIIVNLKIYKIFVFPVPESLDHDRRGQGEDEVERGILKHLMLYNVYIGNTHTLPNDTVPSITTKHLMTNDLNLGKIPNRQNA